MTLNDRERIAMIPEGWEPRHLGSPHYTRTADGSGLWWWTGSSREGDDDGWYCTTPAMDQTRVYPDVADAIAELDGRSGAMTAKPWPHDWRHGMQFLPVPEMDLPPAMVYQASLTMLRCVDIGGGYEHGAAVRVDPRDPRVQPDLDDDGTLGILKGKVREESGDVLYALELNEEFEIDDDGCTPGWFDPVTSRSYATEGKAYVAALEKLAADAKVTP